MSVAPGYVQVAVDSTGKRVDNTTVTLPTGTVVVNSDGSTTTLTADTTVYRQALVIGDPSEMGARASVSGEDGRGALETQSRQLDEITMKLTEIHELLELMVGMLT